STPIFLSSHHLYLLVLHSFPTRRSSDLFILMISSSLGLAQRSDLVSSSSIGGQIVRYGGLKESALVLLDHSGSTKDQRTFTDLRDRKSTRLNSSHVSISYAVFCLKKKKI